MNRWISYYQGMFTKNYQSNSTLTTAFSISLLACLYTISAINITKVQAQTIVASKPATRIATPVSANQTGRDTLVAIKPVQLNNGRMAIDLNFGSQTPEFTHFILPEPYRLVIDFPNTSNATKNARLALNKGLVEEVLMVEDEKRLRMVIALSETATFSSQTISNGYRLNFSTANKESALKFEGVDFHRTPDGGGQVIVKLSDDNAVVDFREQSGELIADFKHVSIGKENERRIDVVDFATPVNTIDVYHIKNDVRMVISPNGLYKHTVTQTKDRFMVTISPLTKQEQLSLNEDESGYSGEKLSLNFQRIPVRAALQVIADFTKLNIITSDSVTGDLSLRLNDVPWDQALDLILQTKNLGQRQKGNVIRVAPNTELAEQERAEFTARQDVTDLEPLVTELIRINYAKAEDISKLLKSVKAIDTGLQQTPFGSVSLSEIQTEENTLLSARGSVTVDSRTNSLLIQDTPNHIREIRGIIKKLDIPVRQIQIETRIVEATDDFSRSLGARLGFSRITTDARTLGTNVGNVINSGSLEATTSIREDNTVLFPDSLSVNLGADDLGIESASRYAFQVAKLGAGYLQLLDLELSALQAEGKGKVIANPKITTTDKHEAHIEQGQERVFTSTSLVGGGTITKKAVLGLTVTPQITPDDKIVLDVFITNDSFAGDTTLNTKQIQTQTLLDNGETIVIGGIYQQDESNLITKTPFLGDLPIIGNLFKKRTRRNNRTELLVFLTPRIIKPSF